MHCWLQWGGIFMVMGVRTGVEIIPGWEIVVQRPWGRSSWSPVSGGEAGRWKRQRGEDQQIPRPRETVVQTWTCSRCVRSLAVPQEMARKGVGRV